MDLDQMETMNCIIFGGSGEVGGAVVQELLRSDVCAELTMIGRRVVNSLKDETKVNQVVVDTSSPDLEKIVQEIAMGHNIAISCLGIGSGTRSMTEEQMMEVEVNMFGKIVRGCKAAGIEIFEVLMAVGVKESHASSRIKEFRVMGKKYKTVLDVRFEKLAVFKPGMIVGNAHTPRWLPFFTQIIPDSMGWGNIHQTEIAKAFVAHLEKGVDLQRDPVVSYGNKEMKLLIKDREGS
jgi:NAD(P)-dependent dehydrogenase (short-subunit alcohol dehydrogenase family)